MHVRTTPGMLLSFLLLIAALSSTAADDETAGLLPKDDLGVRSFLAEHPEADGRGVLVAVLDTGVDVLHPALQETSDGHPKIADFYDGTGAGLVETTVTAKAAKGKVTGLSGRRLTLPPDVVGELRLGLVRASVIYPRGLLRRLRRERKAERERRKRFAADRGAKGGAPPPDPGDPVHDLVLEKRKDGWRVLVDTDSDGDLAEEKPLREFAASHDVGVFGGDSRLGFGVRVVRDGAGVSLLYDGGGHGTHVAGIIAGYHGKGSPLNGLAPGARILAVKIGDGRLGGPTTHLAMLRGLEWAGRAGADVVNISFGGPSLFDDGREVSARFIDDAIRKYGYAVCVSAGNAGPALRTVGSPATSRLAFTVGAWCSAATQRSNYGVVSPRGGALFGFSSRGPLPGGALGVDFLAPGAAVSSVPEWGLVAGRNMNGTSMAAPQASGAVACLISAARREGIPVDHLRLAAALRRGARPVPGPAPVEQGYGLIDVAGALEALRATAKEEAPVDWVCRGGAGGGCYEPASTGDEPLALALTLAPVFPEGKGPEAARRKARFERILRLEPGADWLQVATPVHVASRGATVHARADPARMAPGLNSTVIRAIDLATGREEARLPVTVIRPRVVPRCGVWTRERVKISAGEKRSIFLRVPPGATVVRVEWRETHPEGGSRVALGSRSFYVRERELEAPPAREAGRLTVRHGAVRPGETLEIVVSRPFRAPPGPSEVEVGACFKGLSAMADAVRIPRGRLGTHVNLLAGGHVRGRFVARAEWEEEPLRLAWKTARDPDAPLLLGEETLFLHEGTASFRVPPAKGEIRFDLAFESPFEDYLDDATFSVEDENGRILAQGLVWRGAFSFRPPHRGRFLLRIRVWERGRRFFRGGTIFSPVLLRKIRPRSLVVRHDIREGYVPGGPSGRRFDLPDGTRTAPLILRPKGGGTVRGTIRFVDEEWGTDLLTLPLRVGPPEPFDREASLKRDLAGLLEGEVADAFRAGAPAAAVLARLRKLLEAAKALGAAPPEAEARLLATEARVSPALAKRSAETLAARIAKGGPGVEAFRRARVEALLLAGDAKAAEAERKKLTGKGEEEARLSYLLARHAGKAKEALRELDRYLKTAPSRPELLADRFTLLLSLGRTAEARKLLLGWTERFPRRAGDVAAMAAKLAAGQ